MRLVLALLLLGLPPTARAWSAREHDAVGRLAQRLLSPDTQRAVAQLYGPGVTLGQIAACADQIRGQRGTTCAGVWLDAEPESSHWHFINAPVTSSPRAPGDLKPYCPGGACVVDQVRAAADALKAGKKATDRQVALMFLVHLVGDEHQPLHCATALYRGADDRGGNAEPVAWDGTAATFGQLSLHGLWDHLIAPTDENDPAALADELYATLPPDASSWAAGDYVGAAALESFAIAQKQIYPAYDATGGRIDAAYVAKFRPVAKRRLQMAGVRLAALIEAALAPQTSVASLTENASKLESLLQPPAFQ